MVTLFFLKIIAGIVLGIGTGVVLGTHYGTSDAVFIMVVYSIIGIGWWIGILFLMKQGFGNFFNVFFSGFINMFSFLGQESVIGMLIGLFKAFLQMATAVFRSTALGWKELIHEVQAMKKLNDTLTGHGIAICHSSGDIQAALCAKATAISVESSKGLNRMLEEVYDIAPWLYGCFQLTPTDKIKDHAVLVKNIYKVSYVQGLAAKAEDVVTADSAWSLGKWVSSASAAGMPQTLQLLTKDPKALKTAIEKEAFSAPALLPGLTSFQIDDHLPSHPQKNWTNLFLRFEYALDKSSMAKLDSQVKGRIRKIEDDEFGGLSAEVPNLVKIFLVYSYIQQEYRFDADEEFEYWDNFHAGTQQTNPLVASYYSVFMNRKGLSPSFAAAFKVFMDDYHIESQLIYGWRELSSSSRSSRCPRIWNLVRIADRWCHVDAAFGKEHHDTDIYVQGFMRTDKQMQKELYQWDEAAFPSCTTANYGHNRIEELIEDHETEYLSIGINSKYLTPV